MKTKYLAFAALCGAVVFGVTACGDDVINIKNDDVYSIVDTLDSAACTKDAEGNMSLVRESGEMYVCSNGEWKNIAGSDAINLRCSSELLKDSSGYMIICDGDTIGTVYNNNTTSISDRFKQAVIDSLEKVLKASADSLKKEQQAAIDAKINELKDKDSSDNLACQIADSKIDESKKIQTVEIKCGDNTSSIELPVYLQDKNLSKKYHKHVVVRFPVKANKKSGSRDIYEEIWAALSSGNNSELSIMDLDSNLEQTGKLFVSDLIASNPQSFVTVEAVEPADKTKENVVTKKVEYSVARLEGDFDVTNLVNSVVQLRVKLSLSANFASTDIVYNAIVNLDDEGDIVIDFLTDYKAARVKELVKGGKNLSTASKTANGELAAALALRKDVENYPAFETYLPDSIELNEYVNSVIWVMALFDQADLAGNINKVYADYRTTFAKNGNFNTAIKASFNGKEQSLFFVDYLTLLINANFDKWEQCEGNMWNCSYEYDGYKVRNEVLYKILQKGFKEAYKLPDSDKDTFVMTNVEGGLFKFFMYTKSEKIWAPVSLYEIKEYEYILNNIVPLVDSTAKCKLETDEGNSVSFKVEGEEVEAVCVVNSSPSWQIEYDYFSSSSYESFSSSSFQLTFAEILELKLGECDESVMKKAEIKDFDVCEADVSTTTCYNQYKCDCKIADTLFYGCKWVKLSDTEKRLDQVCNADLVKKKTFSNNGEYVCDTTYSREGTINNWRYPTTYEYCDKNAKTPTKKYASETISEEKQIYAYCHTTNGETYVKKTKDAAWENVYDYFDDCIVPECSSSGADILMEGYEEAEIYSCYISGQYSYWYKDSLDGIIQKAKNQNTPGALDNLSKEIQCRYNYKMPADGYVGYTYTGTAKNRNGETNFYLSNDKQTWSTINNICNNWLDEERGMRVDYLDNSCDADYACHLADSVYYYDFRTEKWSTLQSMQLTECPERSNYCDTHSDLATEFKMTCSEAICEPEYQHMECADGRKEGEDGCDCNEDGADCAAVNDPAPDYCGYEKRSCYFPFAAPDYQPSCSEEGEWVVIH